MNRADGPSMCRQHAGASIAEWMPTRGVGVCWAAVCVCYPTVGHRFSSSRAETAATRPTCYLLRRNTHFLVVPHLATPPTAGSRTWMRCEDFLCWYQAGPRGPHVRCGGDSTASRSRRHHRGTFLGDAWHRPVFCAWSGEVGRKRPCHGEPVPIDLRFQLHQATHLEADHLGLLVAYDQQRGKPAEERHVADERKRLVLGLRSKPLRDRYHRVIRRKTRSSLDARLHADLATSSCAVCSARSFPLCRQPLMRTSAARALSATRCTAARPASVRGRSGSSVSVVA